MIGCASLNEENDSDYLFYTTTRMRGLEEDTNNLCLLVPSPLDSAGTSTGTTRQDSSDIRIQVHDGDIVHCLLHSSSCLLSTYKINV